ncbi:MAG: TonB-dependent receptor domain-containing protein, partial [Gammaproteobacteria bacterium]
SRKGSPQPEIVIGRDSSLVAATDTFQDGDLPQFYNADGQDLTTYLAQASGRTPEDFYSEVDWSQYQDTIWNTTRLNAGRKSDSSGGTQIDGFVNMGSYAFLQVQASDIDFSAVETQESALSWVDGLYSSIAEPDGVQKEFVRGVQSTGRQLAREVRFGTQNRTRWLNWMVGRSDYQQQSNRRETLDFASQYAGVGERQFTFSDYQTEFETARSSTFAGVALRLSGLKLSHAVRNSSTRITGTNTRSQYGNGEVIVDSYLDELAPLTVAATTFDRTDAGESSRSAVELQFGPNHLIYGAQIETFKAGGQLGDALSAPYELLPETSEGEELGLQLHWAKFGLQLTSFDYTLLNLQSWDRGFSLLGERQLTAGNLDEAEVSGSELRLYFKIARFLQFQVQMADLDAQVVAGSLPFIDGTGSVSYAGNRLAHAPEEQYGANLQIHFSRHVALSVSGRQRTGVYTSARNLPHTYIPEHSLTDARLIIQSADQGMRLTVYANNIDNTITWTDAINYSGINHGPFINNAMGRTQTITSQADDATANRQIALIQLAPPRTMGMQLDLRF